MIEPKPLLRNVRRVNNPFGRIGALRLDKNEHTVGLPASLVRDALDHVDPEFLSAYPETEPFYEKLAAHLGLARENLLLASGSDGAIRAVFDVFVSSGDRVACLSPSYAMFRVYGEMFGAEMRDIGFGADLSLDMEWIFELIEESPRLLILANPNSPTGTIIPQKRLLEAVKRAEERDVVVLVDEAYFPFHPETVLPEVRRFENLIVTRTFSKAYGLAAIRLGYSSASARMIEMLSRARPMYEANALALHFAGFLLDNMQVVQEYVEAVSRGKEYLLEALGARGFESYPTHANFLLIRVPDAALRPAIVNHLRSQRILIGGGFGAPPLDECIRITLGPPQHMQRVIEEIDTLMEGRGAPTTSAVA